MAEVNRLCVKVIYKLEFADDRKSEETLNLHN
jgi:hypothetical protein